MLEDLRAHIYQELDSGIMLIGSRSALEKLVVELTAALQDALDKEETDWPRELCGFSVPNPDGSTWPYAVSFHLETVTGAKPELPAYSRLPGKYQLVLWLLAIVGMVAVVRWLLSLT